MTLEMPFKDTIDTPDLVHGWSPERSKRLGASVIDAVADTLPLLR
jgi:murein tripeptide amidase MpaA